MGGNWEREPEGEAGRAAGLTLRGREREGSVVRRKHLGPQCSLERRQRLLGSPPASVPDRGGSGLPVLGWEQPMKVLTQCTNIAASCVQAAITNYHRLDGLIYVL